MTLKPLWIFAAAALTLGACGTVTDERLTPIVVDGQTFELRTRTIDGPNGAYETTSAEVYNIHYPCKIDSPGDCEGAVLRGLNNIPFE